MYPVWKALLLQGRIETATAEQVASTLARLHGSSAGNAALREQFATDDIFYPIRLEPYLIETSRKHPQLRATLEQMSESTLATKLALVHGDVSPKNILIGPTLPVILDAECAWYGDPAFDVAFCLNHFLLKCLARRDWAAQYLACFDRFAQTYLAAVSVGVGAGPGGTCGAAAAGAVPGPRRRQVAGGIRRRRSRQGSGAQRRHATDPQRHPPRWPQLRQAWQQALAPAGAAPR